MSEENINYISSEFFIFVGREIAENSADIEEAGGDLVSTNAIQTLTNKTLDLDLNTIHRSNKRIIDESSSETLSNKTLVIPIINKISNVGILTLPTSTDTLVGEKTTDVLTNKTINLDDNNVTRDGVRLVDLSSNETLTNKTLVTPIIGQISNTGTITLPTSTDTLVGRDTTDTLSNKTLITPIISQISNTGTLTLPTDTDTLVGKNTTDTLTNKTLTTPIIVNNDYIKDEYGNPLLIFNGNSSSVNRLKINNAISGGNPSFAAVGDDSNINLELVAKGTGNVVFTTNNDRSVIFDFDQASSNKSTVIKSSHTDNRTITLPDSDDTLVGKNTSDTLTNKTLATPVIDTIIDSNGNEILDFLAFANAVNQLSIGNATSGTAPSLSATGDDTNIDVNIKAKGTGNINLETNTNRKVSFDFSDSSADKTITISSSHTDDRTLSLPDATDTLVGKNTTDELTNKTLTAPIIENNGYIADDDGNELLQFGKSSDASNQIKISNATLGANPTISAVGEDTNITLELKAKGSGNIRLVTNETRVLDFDVDESTAGKTITIKSVHTNNRMITLPNKTDTLVGKTTTDTLTNKTLEAPVIDMGGNTITSVGTPVNATDAVNKSYADDIAVGIKVKTESTIATTENIMIPEGLAISSIIDGITVASGNRVLVMHQIDATENGIYSVPASGDATRATDMAVGSHTAHTYIFVRYGTDNGDMGFVSINDPNSDLVGTNELNFTGFSSAGHVTAGTGLDKTDNTLSIDSTVATLSGTQTLTNKTLTSPIISTITNNDNTIILPTTNDTLVGRDTTDTLRNKTLVTPIISQISNTGTLTLPTSTDTLVGKATTDTLTNKTISDADNTLVINDTSIQSGINANKISSGNVSNTIFDYLENVSSDIQEQLDAKIESGANISIFTNNSNYATTTGEETLTNKTISDANNTLVVNNTSIQSGINANKISSGNVSNTIFDYLENVSSDIQTQLDTKIEPGANISIFTNNANYATTTRTEELTNKTLVAPIIDMGDNKITSVGEPTANSDVATKRYVDDTAQGVQIMDDVRVATTENVNLLSELANGQEIDGITLSTNDRVLVKNQTDATENGIYIILSSGSASRSTDMAAGDQVAHTYIYVASGTVNGAVGFASTNDPNNDVVGTDELSFTGYSSAGSTVAGTGLQKSDNTISIDSTVVTLTRTQTLTNKTLTTPVISQISNTGVLTLPTSTDTLVGKATTDTLTNKTISDVDNTLVINDTSIQSGINANKISSGNVSNTIFDYLENVSSDIQTQLNNKIESGANISIFTNNSNYATTTGEETLTNKTISDADNTLVINDTSIQSGINANKISSGNVSNTNFDYLENVSSDIQTQLDTKIESGANISIFTNNSNYATTSGEETLTNKTISDVSNTLVVNNTSIQSGVNANKISSGNVSNTIFDYLENVSSDIQTQLDTKIESGANISIFTNNANYVTTTGAEELTNKTLSSPIIDMGGNKITSVGTPTFNGDVATKGYVDDTAQGVQVKDDVKVATTANVDLDSGLANGEEIDGIILVTNDRVLVKDQTDATENGIYIVPSSGSASRSTDMATASQVAHTYVFVESGTANVDVGFVCTNDPNSDIVGTNEINFTAYSSAGSTTAGTGLEKLGNTISIDSTIATLNGTQILTNKTISDTSNTLVINDTSIQSGLNANKISSGNVSNTHFDYLENVSSDIQTQLDTKIESGANISIFTNNANYSVITGTETLENKTISDASNTLVINDTSIQSGINANKISSGNVSNTIFDYLENVSSDVQTQLDAKIESGANISIFTNNSNYATTTGEETLTNKTISDTSNTLVVNDTSIQSGINANKISSGNVSNTIFDYLENVSSDVQTQLDAKIESGANISIFTNNSNYATTTGEETLTNKTISDTSNTLVVNDTSIQSGINANKISSGNITNTIFDYLENVSSDIQTQLNAKIESGANISIFTNNANYVTTTGEETLTNKTLSTPIIDMGNNKITSVGIPTLNSDVATKSYVDNAAQGVQIMDDVKVATTEEIAISEDLANGQEIDGITLVTDDRVLVKNQSTDATENGIYVVPLSGAASRSSDMGTGVQVAHTYIYVESGTVNGNVGFACTNDPNTDVVGTDAINFTGYSSAGSTRAGTGLQKSGNTISVDSTIVTLSGTQTLENKTISDVSNTLVINDASIQVGLNANKISSGNVTNTIFDYLENVSSDIQTQLDAKIESGANISIFTNNANYVTTTGTETLTNKTLTTPIISQISNTGTLTLPTSTDTLVGRDTTDTLTNKTITNPFITQIQNNDTFDQVGSTLYGSSAYDRFGWSVAMDSVGDTIVCGAARTWNASPAGPGYTRIYNNVNGVWTQLGSDIEGEANSDQSGYSVTISSDGTRIAIGATGNDDGGASAGNVRVYDYAYGSWSQVGSDIDGLYANGHFGQSVSLSFDGSVLAIGGIGPNTASTWPGYVRIYEYSSGWSLTGYLTGASNNDYFGASVSLSSDGTIVVIGASIKDYGSTGYVRIYQYSSSTWSQLGSTITGETSGTGFGASVSINSDGTIIAVGAPGNDDGGNNAGSVKVYQYSSSTWSQLGSDIDGGGTSYNFGSSVKLSSNGTRLIVGSTGYNSNRGRVQVYEYSNSSWTQLGINLDGDATGNSFGQSVCMNDAGTIIGTSAPGESGILNSRGSVKIYSYVDGQLTLPVASDTLIGRSTTDILTNKTIDTTSNTIMNGFVDGFAQSVPLTSKGQSGDVKGYWAKDESYLYKCIDSYDGSTDIWIRESISAW